MKSATFRTSIIGMVLVAVAVPFAFAQQPPQLQLPRVSPKATVSQTVGLTEITVTYCRPGVKGRVIWGGLVPYDQVWRTGANEATTITFTDAVTVAGKPVPAGTYGLFTIPGKETWTIILNKAAQQWGAFDYKPEQDLMRFQVKPQATPELNEWLTIAFPNLTPTSAELAIVWEKLRVPFTIEVDVVGKVLPMARKAVAEAKPDDWRTPLRAASFALDFNTDLGEAAQWIDKSLAIKPGMGNLFAKARLLALQGNKAEALATAKRAIETGRAQDPKAETGPIERFIADLQK